jgi:uncharacterized protein YggE
MIHRTWKSAIIAIAAMAAAPAIATDVPVTPLAPDEVLLELASTGLSHNQADKVTAQVTVSASASTSAEARRLVASQVERFRAAARAAGVAADDIKVEHPQRFGFVGNAAYDLPEELPQPQKATASAVIEIRLREPSRFGAVRDALEAAGATNVAGPAYDLSDDRTAREQAKADALAKGRAEAEAYARSLGMRVVRLVRVSERPTTEALSAEMMQNMMKQLSGGSDAGPDVETTVSVTMDFALGQVR